MKSPRINRMNGPSSDLTLVTDRLFLIVCIGFRFRFFQNQFNSMTRWTGTTMSACLRIDSVNRNLFLRAGPISF